MVKEDACAHTCDRVSSVVFENLTFSATWESTLGEAACSDAKVIDPIRVERGGVAVEVVRRVKTSPGKPLASARPAMDRKMCLVVLHLFRPAPASLR